MSERAYCVERVSRCVVTLLVHASSADEARAVARAGGGEQIETTYQHRGYGRARREPSEDRLAVEGAA